MRMILELHVFLLYMSLRHYVHPGEEGYIEDGAIGSNFKLGFSVHEQRATSSARRPHVAEETKIVLMAEG